MRTAWSVLILIALAALPSAGQSLQDSGLALPGVWAGEAAWGDYDGDGDPDLILVGEIRGSDGNCERIARVLRNDSGQLVEDASQTERLAGVYFGDAGWADYDGDGDLDLAVAGWDEAGDESLGLYLNSPGADPGSRRLTLDLGQVDAAGQAVLLGVRYADLAWGDADRDGDLDLLVSGMNGRGDSATRLYANGGGLFALDESNSEALLNVHNGDLAWADYDNDGDLDLALAGENVHAGRGLRRVTEFYANAPAGTFTLDAGLTAVALLNGGSLAWGDYDGDGNLDLAQSGRTETWTTALQLFLNRPAGTLTADPGFALNAFLRVAGGLAWVDYDNDGDLDLAASGRTILSDRRAFVFENRGGSVSAVSAEASVAGLAGGTTVWGDYDGDGRADLLLTGVDGDGQRRTVLYANSVATQNRAPDPPASLNPVSVTGHRVLFSWPSGADQESPVLTYNLRIGTASVNVATVDTAHIGDILSAAVALKPGNTGAKTSYVLDRTLPPDTYFWSVQAVDGGLARSDFADEGQFVVGQFVSSDQSLRGVSDAAMAWGDADGDGDLDLALMGTNRSGEAQTLVYVNRAGVLVLDTGAGLLALTEGDLAWGDYDGDGDLDLFTSGHVAVDNRDNALYRVQVVAGDSLVFDPVLRFLPELDFSAAAWGDVDNDGDLDLVHGGQSAEEGGGVTLSFTRVWVGDGQGGFEPRDDGLVGLNNGDLALGDVDGDGDPDLVASGVSSAGQRRTDLYRNDLSGGFAAAAAGLEGLESSDLALGDYDRDGDLDLAAGGITGGNALFTGLYDNSAGDFSEAGAIALPGIRGGDLAWADYDNDQDLDLVVAGNTGDTAILQVWENTIGQAAPGSAFELVALPGLAGVDNSAVAMADADGDGDLDLVSAGRTVALTPSTAVNDNLTAQQGNANFPPTAPAALAAQDAASAVALRWDAGADDGDPPPASLTYNVRVGTSPAAHDVVSGRRPQGRGNAGHRRSLDLQGLASGTYYWSVQTVDAGFAPSAFAAEQSFTIDTVQPQVDTLALNSSQFGLGQTVTLALGFADAHSGMATDPAPAVEAVIGDQRLPFRMLQFTGAAWSGELTIDGGAPSGEALIAVRSARDRKGNELIPFDRPAAFRVDAERPAVVGRAPAAGDAEVAPGERDTVTVTFSEPLDGATATAANFALRLGTAPVPVTVAYDASALAVTLAPEAGLQPGSEYTVEVSPAVADLAGNRADEVASWTFRTRVPRLVATTPGAGAAGVAIGDGRIEATFDAGLLRDALQPAEAVRVLREGVPVPLRESPVYDAQSLTLRFEPAEGLRPGSRYEVVLSAQLGGPLRALSGDGDFRWQFQTATPGATALSPAAGDTVADGAEASLSATFDHPIDAQALDQEGSVQVLREGVAVPLREEPVYDAQSLTLRFEPAGGLRPGSRYEVVLSALLGGPLRAVSDDGDFRWQFQTATPGATALFPPAGTAVDAGAGAVLSATFDYPIDEQVLSQEGSVQVLREGVPVALREAPDFDPESLTLRFEPTEGLRPGSRYEVVLAGLLAGPLRALSDDGDFRWQFQTATPGATALFPPAGAMVDAVADAALSATFDHGIDEQALALEGSVQVLREGVRVELRGAPDFDPESLTLRFEPAGGLRPGSRYDVVLSAQLGGPLRVLSDDGDFRWQFQTAVPAATTLLPPAGATVAISPPSLAATFDHPIDLLALGEEGSALVLREGAPVALREDPVFEAATQTLRFEPAEGLRPGSRYEVVLSALLGGPLRALSDDGDFRWQFQTAVPEAVALLPPAGATVAVSPPSLAATFDHPIDLLALGEEGSVLVLREGVPVTLREDPVFEAATRTLRFEPAGGLRPGSGYEVILAALLGGPLRAVSDLGDFRWPFQTAVAEVVTLAPADGDTAVGIGLAALSATFDGALDEEALGQEGSALLFRDGVVASVAELAYDGTGHTLELTPAEGLKAGSSYRVQVGAAVRGPRAEGDLSWTFATRVPRVVATEPAAGAAVPAGSRRVQVQFSSAVDRERVVSGNFRISRGGQPVALADGEFLYDAATFTVSLPVVDLVSGSQYDVAVSARLGGPRSTLADHEFAFRTDIPAVVEADPAAGAEGVSTTQATVRVAFSAPIARQDGAGFSLRARSLAALLAAGGDGPDLPFEIAPITGFGTNPALTVANFAPVGGFAPFTEYEVVIDRAVLGELASEGASWRFSTASRLADAAAGGTVVSADRAVELYLPPNALAGGTGEIAISPLAEPAGKPAAAPAQDRIAVGRGFRLDAGAAQLRKPATLTLRYTAAQLGTSSPRRLGIFALSGDRWTRVGGTPDPAARTVATAIDALGTFALFEDLATAVGAVALRDLDCQPRAFAPAGGDLRGATDISFELTAPADVTVRVYNAAGRLERVVASESLAPGRHALPWDGRDDDDEVVASGLYVVVVSAGGAQAEKVVAVVR